MKRLPNGYDIKRHVMSFKKDSKLSRNIEYDILTLTWSNDAPTMAASGMKIASIANE